MPTGSFLSEVYLDKFQITLEQVAIGFTIIDDPCDCECICEEQT